MSTVAHSGVPDISPRSQIKTSHILWPLTSRSGTGRRGAPDAPPLPAPAACIAAPPLSSSRKRSLRSSSETYLGFGGGGAGAGMSEVRSWISSISSALMSCTGGGRRRHRRGHDGERVGGSFGSDHNGARHEEWWQASPNLAQLLLEGLLRLRLLESAAEGACACGERPGARHTSRGGPTGRWSGSSLEQRAPRLLQSLLHGLLLLRLVLEQQTRRRLVIRLDSVAGHAPAGLDSRCRRLQLGDGLDSLLLGKIALLLHQDGRILNCSTRLRKMEPERKRVLLAVARISHLQSAHFSANLRLLHFFIPR